MCVTRLKQSSSVLTGTRLRLGALEHAGAAGGWQLAVPKDRDVPALEVRPGTPGVVQTSRDTAGLSSTNRNRVEGARTSMENSLQSLCSETKAEIRPLLL